MLVHKFNSYFLLEFDPFLLLNNQKMKNKEILNDLNHYLLFKNLFIKILQYILQKINQLFLIIYYLIYQSNFQIFIFLYYNNYYLIEQLNCFYLSLLCL